MTSGCLEVSLRVLWMIGALIHKKSEKKLVRDLKNSLPIFTSLQSRRWSARNKERLPTICLIQERTGRNKKDNCLSTSVRDGTELQRSALSKNSTIKVKTCGLLVVFLMRSCFSSNQGSQRSSTRKGIFSKVVLASQCLLTSPKTNPQVILPPLPIMIKSK